MRPGPYQRVRTPLYAIDPESASSGRLTPESREPCNPDPSRVRTPLYAIAPEKPTRTRNTDLHGTPRPEGTGSTVNPLGQHFAYGEKSFVCFMQRRDEVRRNPATGSSGSAVDPLHNARLARSVE